ncbi:MAG: hypothetical protein U0271_02900 [Polyangiaceae bacterium]
MPRIAWSRVRFSVVAGTCVASCVAGCSADDTRDETRPSPFDTTEELPSSRFELLVATPRGPAGIPTQPANNNLDVAVFGGRTYLAWRTAPTHFASAAAEILVVSEGEDGFRFEGRFTLSTDLREPRLLAMGDRLVLYFAVLGTDPLAFEPQGTMATEYLGPDDWTAPKSVYLPGFIPWRARVVDGRAFLIGYEGGENIYQFNGDPLRVHLLTTEDGFTFEPANPDEPILLEGGVSETDFALLDDGSIVLVGRNEAGDERFGFGSVICRSAPGGFGDLRCVSDPRKFDSPLVLSANGAVWLFARRNVTPTGDYDLGYGLLPLEEQAVAYESAYTLAPKRCALWRVDPDSLEVSWVQDLPSRGDTCFPAATVQSDTVTVYNYTNSLHDLLDCADWPTSCSDIPWGEGQLRPTEIYRMDLALPPPE